MDIPQVKKQAFRNDSGGFVGYVSINVKGEERGRAVAPGEIVWLTREEQIATANAPRLAKDNPFVAQSFERVNPDTSEIETFEVTPLQPITEERYVPAGDRPIPGLQPEDPAPLAAGQGAATPPPSEPDPAPPTVREMTPPTPPARATAAAQAAEEAPVEEETALEATAPAEETGAAVEPAGAAVEGEYAQHEEVATPLAAAAGPPAPYTPGSDPEGTPPPDPSGE